MNQQDHQFTAIVLAADRAADDPVAVGTGAACKAFAPICGIPMILRVLDALEDSGMVKRIIICGPPKPMLPRCPELEKRIECGRAVWLPSLGSPSRSANSCLAHIDQDDRVLLTTADHALLTPEIVQYFLKQPRTAQADAMVGAVRYEDVAAAFPGAKRTVIKLRDAWVCGCNLYAFLTPRGRDLVSFWQRAEDLRKRPWRLIAETFGFRTVLYYLLGQLTIGRGLESVAAKSGVKVQPVFLPYPQAGVDVDKIEDVRLAEAVLSEGVSRTMPKADSRGPAH